MSYTISKKNPSSSEERTSLVNASDGAGLHFDGAAGNIAFTPVDLGTKFSFEFVIKSNSFGSTAQHFIDFGNGGRFILASRSDVDSYNLAIFDNSSWVSLGVKVLDDLKVHHLTLTVDGTSAKLYDNGNEVGSATISASHGIDSCTRAKLGCNEDGLGQFISANYYRCRLWNKALSSAEVQTAFERVDVDFADQYGSASNLITNGNFETNTSGWTSENTSTFQRNTTSPISGTGDLEWTGDGSGYPGAISNSFSLTAGKKYRIKFTYRVTSGTVYLKFGKTASAASAAVAGISEVALTASSNTAYEATVTPTESTTAYIVFRGNNNTTPTMFVDLVDFVQIGCVSDYDLAFAQPALSTLIQDRSNAADGVASSSGVTQVQPITQLNSTSARIGSTQLAAGTAPYIPADGSIVADKIGINVDPVQRLHIDGDGDADILLTRTTANTDGTLGRIFFGGNNFDKYLASIEAYHDGTVDSAALKFTTETAATNDRLTRLTIDSTGRVGIGKSPDTTFEVAASSAHARITGNSGTSPELQLSSAGAVNWKLRSNVSSSDFRITKDSTDHLTIDSTGNVTVDGGQVTIKSDSSNDTPGRLNLWATDTSIVANDTIGAIHAQGTDTVTSPPEDGAKIEFNADFTWGGSTNYQATRIDFFTQDNSGTNTLTSPRLTIDSDGLCTFNNGIAFSQTNSSATGAAVSTNGTILNHYEEGTWTPVPKDNQATVVATSTALGRYVRVGKIVTCTYRLVRNDTQSLTNSLYLYGLPFPSQNNVQTKNIGGGTSWFPNDTYAGFNYALENTDQWIIRKNDATGYATTNVWSNGQELIGTIIYEADA